MPEIKDQLEKVGEAFSRQSPLYDAYEEDHVILKWMRSQVRAHALEVVKPGDGILELNAGTGIDAVFFARMGCRVHATDISDGMLGQLRGKVNSYNLHDRLTIQKCSLTELEAVEPGRYDYIFSNFGGLNCVQDLTLVTKRIPRLLKPGGFLTLVMMPPICPWELALVFRGHFKTAIRRLNRRGVLSHIEGVYFMSYYFSPLQVLKALGGGFRKVKLQGLASLSPPPYMENLPKKYPELFRALRSLDERLSGISPFNRWADHFILTVQYQPGT